VSWANFKQLSIKSRGWFETLSCLCGDVRGLCGYVRGLCVPATDKLTHGELLSVNH